MSLKTSEMFQSDASTSPISCLSSSLESVPVSWPHTKEAKLQNRIHVINELFTSGRVAGNMLSMCGVFSQLLPS